MTTPVVDFVRAYASSGTSRLHMPGHKGRGPLGCELVDITEIKGADDLSCPEGIIHESEANATALFGTRATLYSAGGSSQCVKAMLLLCARRSKSRKILAARNVHKSFVYACALLDLCPEWLYPVAAGSLCSCPITAQQLREHLAGTDELPCAVYVTSPDYLGGMQDIAALATAAHEFNVPLIVDNAHGAYLRFLAEDAHPITLGADMCCDSAHKTLGVLTGGAYLHISRRSAWDFERGAREALGAFGSSSPSYLIMASLDAFNAQLAGEYPADLDRCVRVLNSLKADLTNCGVHISASDPLRLTVEAYRSGYTGVELAELLREHGCECEFADRDRLVCMFTPANAPRDFDRVRAALATLEHRSAFAPLPAPEPADVDITPRAAFLAPRESVPLKRAIGRTMASAAVTCPPAIPIVVMGERISPQHVQLMAEYGIDSADVVIS